MASMTLRLASLATLPKTVKPPFWLFRLAELSARLKKNSVVALLGLPSSLAMARVPRVLEIWYSLRTGASAGILVNWELYVQPPV